MPITPPRRTTHHPTAAAVDRSRVGAGERLLSTPAFRAGVRQFNAGEYYECHETLETLWLTLKADADPAAAADSLFVQGLIQLAVALYKWSQANRRGALFLQERALFKWRDLPDHYAGVDLARLRRAVQTCFAPLKAAATDEPPPALAHDSAPLVVLAGDRP